MKQKLAFAKEYTNMSLDYWKKVLWSYESKYNLKSSDGAQKIWRKSGEAYKLSCMRENIKFGTTLSEAVEICQSLIHDEKLALYKDDTLKRFKKAIVPCHFLANLTVPKYEGKIL